MTEPAAAIHDPEDVVASRSWEFGGPLLDFNGDPLPLTNAAIVWKLDSLDGGTNLLTLTLGAGITIVDLPSATILVDAAAAQTTSVPPGVYRDWLTATLSDGSVLDCWSGVIRVSAAPA